MNPPPLCPDRVQWTRGRIQNPCGNWGLSPCVPVVDAGTQHGREIPGRLYVQHAWERYKELCCWARTLPPIRASLLTLHAGTPDAWQCRLSLHTWHIIIKKSRSQLRRGNRHTREEELFCPQLILIRLSRFRLGLRACAVAFAWFESYSIECRTVNPEGFGLMTGTTQRADRSTEL